MVDSKVIESHTVPKEVPIYRLVIKDAFEKLTEKEKLYSHYFSLASWWGSQVCLGQTSVESPVIFKLLQSLFSLEGGDVDKVEKRVVPSQVTKEEFTSLLMYASSFYGNMGNYLSFGDSKFIPRISKESLNKLIESLQCQEVSGYWNQCKDLMYSLDENQRELGIDGTGVSTYYSPNITKVEIEKVQKFMDKNGISGYNTRLFRAGLESNKYRLLIASAKERPVKSHTWEDIQIDIIYGDWSVLMGRVANYLQQAIPFAANENQTNMLKKYVDHFTGGNIDDHKDSQRFWIKDQQPVVETNIGFIESYRDPFGVRGEFEGFVSVVNKIMTERLGVLLKNAEVCLSKLPWTKDYEKDKFLKPDFTSLEVLTYASTGLPTGINLSNYDDIRQNEGFKNVSLGNVLTARKDEYITFIHDKDQKIFNQLFIDAMEVQVGLHELIGHGSGKTFVVDKDGKYNFNTETTVNSLTGKPLNLKEEVYQPGESYDSRFKSLGSAMEECRAECVGVYLSPDEKVLEFFHFQGEKANDVYYANWLIMCKAGLTALEFYTPENKKWRQAHMQGRFAILQIFLKCGVLTLDRSKADDITILLNRELIKTVGVKAIGDFLNEIQVLKATGNATAANELFDRLTIQPITGDWLAMRDIVIQKKKPRRVFCQANTVVNNNKVELVEYDDSPQGLIKSMISRFGKDFSGL
ncbi:dipeptidyl-peptidase III [Tieghemostelium lacteum]|uniref:Dipeptidyl peptidase 3 n=1 Tax=Tieghemostelium lacteum TaxID=361077 RepID=A0A152A6A2_TIELA|nr:dipeptidyl-peptidase III [Tieghemostelium lacteum]|eukprot:KYR01753.1 dipeptidyl-peptidase III [Tieghemostelium lacteum]